VRHAIEIEEGDRQLILLALAVLGLQRPGFDHALRAIARQLPDARAEEMYDAFRASNDDQDLARELAAAWKLLGATEHALRSYQYGNAAPGLAQEIADACAELRSSMRPKAGPA
jgi:hypothetical protein